MRTGVFVYLHPYGVAAPCGSDWSTPCATLADGIAQAASAFASQIWIGPGVTPLLSEKTKMLACNTEHSSLASVPECQCIIRA